MHHDTAGALRTWSNGHHDSRLAGIAHADHVPIGRTDLNARCVARLRARGGGTRGA